MIPFTLGIIGLISDTLPLAKRMMYLIVSTMSIARSSPLPSPTPIFTLTPLKGVCQNPEL